ncbi:amidohydrolase family protein [Brevibacterium siliguriense]|uniref:amidohydrolase family protein n=1 Tax=Brevibacterium siliguriense TaxID=1136497 RepID=UPI001E5D1231|nr:amidohydrolase family protein [Brevibacterium siliguriense]
MVGARTRTGGGGAHGRGPRTALGTDSSVCPHGQNLREVVHAVELGLRPMEAIVAGTRNAAELLRLDRDLGTLEAGRLADLIVVRPEHCSHHERLSRHVADSSQIMISRISSHDPEGQPPDDP